MVRKLHYLHQVYHPPKNGTAEGNHKRGVAEVADE